MTTIRKATQQDRLSIFKLCIAMHETTDFANYTLNPEKLLNNLGWWIGPADDALMLVAERDGEVVGFFAGKLTKPWFSDDIMAVEDVFFVRQEDRGTRAAYKLAKEFRDWAYASGAAHIRAGVSSGAGRAGERLYEFIGMSNMGGNFVAHIKEGADHVLQ